MTAHNIHIVINKNILITIFFTVLLLFILSLMSSYIIDLLLPIGISIILTMLLEPVVSRLESRGIGRTGATLIVLVLVTGMLGFGSLTLIPLLNNETESIKNLLSSQGSSIFMKIKIPFFDADKILALLEKKFSATNIFLFNQSSKLLPSPSILLIIVPVMTFFLLKEGYYFKKSILQLLPNRYFEMVLNLIYKLNQLISRWLREQLFIALISGGIATVALYLLNINNYLLIGIVVGLAYLTPYYGALIGAIITITASLLETGSLNPVVGLIIALATIKLLYNFLLAQKVTSDKIKFHPLIIIFLLLAGTFMGGLIGMLLAVPVSSITILVGKEIYWSLTSYRFIR